MSRDATLGIAGVTQRGRLSQATPGVRAKVLVSSNGDIDIFTQDGGIN